MSVPVLQLNLEKRQVTQPATGVELCAFMINSINITLASPFQWCCSRLSIHPIPLFPNPHTIISLWELGTSHSGNVYSVEGSRCRDKLSFPRLPPPFPPCRAHTVVSILTLILRFTDLFAFNFYVLECSACIHICIYMYCVRVWYQKGKKTPVLLELEL